LAALISSKIARSKIARSKIARFGIASSRIAVPSSSDQEYRIAQPFLDARPGPQLGSGLH